MPGFVDVLSELSVQQSSVPPIHTHFPALSAHPGTTLFDHSSIYKHQWLYATRIACFMDYR